MAIFNIAAATGYELPSASWVNNDPNTRPKPLQLNGGSVCRNAHYSVNSGCESLFGDRFAISSKLRSGSLNTVLSNGNEVNKGNPELSIRIVEDNSAIQANYYNEVYGTFVSGFPQSVLYYLPKQTVSTTYTTSKNFYANSSPTRNVTQTEYQQFLPSNFKDKFANKDNVYIVGSGDVDTSLSFKFNTLVFSLSPDNLGRFVCHFIKPTGNNANLDITTYVPYYNYGNIGIGIDNIKTNFTDSNRILNITYNNEIIFGLLYDSTYNNMEVAIKHPVIQNYLLLTLPSEDFTTLNLENYQ